MYVFHGPNGEGHNPRGPLVFDQQRNLYGTTVFGGEPQPYGYGTVFELTPTAEGFWTETQVYQFNYSDGAYPNPLLRDAAGNLFGTTQYGASTVFNTILALPMSCLHQREEDTPTLCSIASPAPTKTVSRR